MSQDQVIPATNVDSSSTNDVQPEPADQPAHTGRPGDPDQPKARSRFPKPLRWALGVVILVVIVAVGWPFVEHAWNWESTDDAFIDGNTHTISPRVDGYVQTLCVQDNAWVEKGQLLVELDTPDFDASVDAAQAQLNAAQTQYQASQAQLDLIRATTASDLLEAQANIQMAQAAVATAQSNAQTAQSEYDSKSADLRRYERLRKTESVTAQLYQHAQLATAAAKSQQQAAEQKISEAQAQIKVNQAQLAAAQAGTHRVKLQEAQVQNALARIKEAQANLEQAKLALSYTRIHAPVAGYVTRRSVEVGEYVEKGQALMAVVPPEMWVTANFKETQLNQIHVGQEVSVTMDAYSGVEFKGHVQSIQRGTGAVFSLLPPQNATGNYVKVVQRVPVKIIFDQLPDPKKYVLALGMSVVPDVHVARKPDQMAPPAPEASSATAELPVAVAQNIPQHDRSGK